MKPNIIIFNPDEMRADTWAILVIQQPIHLFWMKWQKQTPYPSATLFARTPYAYLAHGSFSTGLYPHVNGHRTMAHLLRPGGRVYIQRTKTQRILCLDECQKRFGLCTG